MKFLFASDSFKGTLSSARIAELLTTAAKESFPDCICTSVETADGGEGTTDAVLCAVKGERIPLTVCGPLWKPTDCFYGKLDENRAIMEMAAASGLPLLSETERNPAKTTTYGTGEMIRDALNHGFRDISIAIGGSATNDGGMGCMCALGVRFLDENGKELEGCGENLSKISRIDLSELDPRVSKTKFTVMCDVNNPLCGENGATYTFGPQKGGSPELLNELESGMLHYRELLLKVFQVDVNEIPGAGAAGGLGAALVVFLNATLKSGIETVLDLVDFDSRLQGVSLVVTGEGRTDWQSAFWKSSPRSRNAQQKIWDSCCGTCRFHGTGGRKNLRVRNRLNPDYSQCPHGTAYSAGTGGRIVSKCSETSVSYAESRKSNAGNKVESLIRTGVFRHWHPVHGRKFQSDDFLCLKGIQEMRY